MPNRAGLKEKAGPGVGIQNLEIDIVTGFAAGASAAISGLSGAVDVPLAAYIVTTGGGVLTKLTLASVSFSNDRVKIVDTSTANNVVQVFWWNQK